MWRGRATGLCIGFINRYVSTGTGMASGSIWCSDLWSRLRGVQGWFKNCGHVISRDGRYSLCSGRQRWITLYTRREWYYCTYVDVDPPQVRTACFYFCSYAFLIQHPVEENRGLEVDNNKDPRAPPIQQHTR